MRERSEEEEKNRGRGGGNWKRKEKQEKEASVLMTWGLRNGLQLAGWLVGWTATATAIDRYGCLFLTLYSHDGKEAKRRGRRWCGRRMVIGAQASRSRA